MISMDFTTYGSHNFMYKQFGYEFTIYEYK